MKNNRELGAKIRPPTPSREQLTKDIVALGEYVSKDDFAKMILNYFSVVDLRFVLKHLSGSVGKSNDEAAE
jgi:hypothetical protein